jgi:hypothetical protein
MEASVFILIMSIFYFWFEVIALSVRFTTRAALEHNRCMAWYGCGRWLLGLARYDSIIRVIDLDCEQQLVQQGKVKYHPN